MTEINGTDTGLINNSNTNVEEQQFDDALLQQLGEAVLLAIVAPRLLDQNARQQETFNEIRREDSLVNN